MTNATIQEIEGIDDYWGPAFRSVYEGEGHAAFVEQLNERIKQHDREIEKLCNFHYQGFIEAIRELLQVRSHAEELHTEISNVDTSVKKTTQDICEKAEELIRARKVELNIASTIQKMELCLPLLVTYSKLKSQVKAKRYYPALKTLEHLEEYLLLRIGPYKWCEQISEDVPRLRQAIRDASMADLTHFLENIRRLSPQVGVLALKQTQEMMGRNLENIIKNKKEASASGTSVTSVCPHELVDFSPLHRCLHIHTELGVKNDFIAYYRAQRRHQARLVLIPQANLHESIQNVKSYIHAVLGFFILEEYLLSTGAELVSKDWLLDTWNMALEKVTNILRSNTSLITDPTLMLTIKHQIVLFINTLECYGLPADSLPTILEELSDHYTEVLMQRWVQLFRDLLDNSTFLPIEVENQKQFDGVMDNFPFEDEALEIQPFPKKFPFSSMVPAVYVQVKEFIYACVKYSGGLRLSAARRAAGARRSASLLLTRSYCGCLAAACRTLALPLTQLHQIIVDTKYLEDATVCLYEFINNITGADLAAVQTPGTMFQAARDEAEQQICEKLEKKIDEFLDLENYDWLLVESRGQASAFVSDMLSYLTGVLAALETLPQRARLAAAERAVSRISERLLRLVLSPVVRAVSAGALHQLDLDVLQCEQFAASEPAGLPQPALLQHLAPLRQLLDLVTGWDWSAYLHDIGVEGGKYPLVSPKDAATLLEKLKEAEQKSSVFSVLKKNERDRRKLLDTVLKQLKQLQTQDGSS